MEHLQEFDFEDFKIRFELIQQVCDLLSDAINNFDWSNTDKNKLIYIWTQVIGVYWDLCKKVDIKPLPNIEGNSFSDDIKIDGLQ